MQENKIEVMAVSQLLNMKFFVPSYQRGYRWTEQEVRDLLEDINDFGKKEKKRGEFYCLQPLVVRAMTEQEKQANELEVGDTWYEVIDGQQRLTTIYLILSTMKALIEAMNLPSNLYELRYQREANVSTNFLKQITKSNEEFCEKVDYYHASNALSTIKQWFQETKANKWCFANTLLASSCDEDEPTIDQSNNVRFIWYESVDEDPIKVFTRLNIGKIGLTNAELIKALLLNSSNFKKEDPSSRKLSQQEIASEWDRIEYTLQKEDFWLFLHEVGYENPTRIDFLFELMCERNMLELEETELKHIGTDANRTFRYFYQYFSQNRPSIDFCWEKVKSLFNTFVEWYDDLQLYHYVGFLIDCKADSISQLVEYWNKSEDKKGFLKTLKEEIKKVIGGCPSLEHEYQDGKKKQSNLPHSISSHSTFIRKRNGTLNTSIRIQKTKKPTQLPKGNGCSMCIGVYLKVNKKRLSSSSTRKMSPRRNAYISNSKPIFLNKNAGRKKKRIRFGILPCSILQPIAAMVMPYSLPNAASSLGKIKEGCCLFQNSRAARNLILKKKPTLILRLYLPAQEMFS